MILNYDLGLFIGHGKSELDGTYDAGAVNGSIKENDLARSIVMKAIEYLKPTQLLVHVDEQNYKDTDLRGNNYNLKYAMTIHINAGGGEGFEFFVPLNEKNFEIENALSYKMKELGFGDRGIKSRYYDNELTVRRTNNVKLSGTDYYKEIREAWSMGISLTIFEVGFIDSSDLGKIQTNIDNIAWILASELAKLKNLELTKPNNITNNNVANGGIIRRVFVDGVKMNSYSLKENVLKEVSNAIDKGANKIEIIAI